MARRTTCSEVGSQEPFAEDTMAAASASVRLAEVIKIDIQLTSLDESKALMKRLEGKPIKFLPEKVTSTKGAILFLGLFEALVFPLWLIFVGVQIGKPT